MHRVEIYLHALPGCKEGRPGIQILLRLSAHQNGAFGWMRQNHAIPGLNSGLIFALIFHSMLMRAFDLQDPGDALLAAAKAAEAREYALFCGSLSGRVYVPQSVCQLTGNVLSYARTRTNWPRSRRIIAGRGTDEAIAESIIDFEQIVTTHTDKVQLCEVKAYSS